MTKEKKSNKKTIINLVLIFFLIILFCIIIYEGINLYKWHKDNEDIEEISEIINDKTIINDITSENEDNVNIIEQKSEPTTSIYWSYIKMNLIDVNLTELKKINPDTVGWIVLNGTNVNYPFVQTKDNDYYMTHSFNKKKNSAGWLFLDYRNSLDKIDKNNIIYGHSRIDKTMFGSLKDTLNKSWYNNKENHIIKLSTDKYDSLWQIFSIYHLPNTNDYLQTVFNSGEEFKEFASMLQNRSIYKFETSVNEEDRILTLSTCHNNTAKQKLVIHAKLIKYLEK